MDWKRNLRTNNIKIAPSLGDQLAEQEKRLEQIMKDKPLAKTPIEIAHALKDTLTQDKGKEEK